MSIKTQINDHIDLAKTLVHISDRIIQMAEICMLALRRGNKILLAGNGGSAADAQHIASEFVGKFNKDRDGFAAIALTTDGSSMTSISNDFGFDKVFSRQVNGLGKQGDVLLLISTSGKSPNLIHAAAEAKTKQIHTIAFLGKGGGNLLPVVDFAINVPSNDTQRIQEMHILLAHLLVGEIEALLLKK
jgi:D-sedoheptulose 7-phosphate isomerase